MYRLLLLISLLSLYGCRSVEPVLDFAKPIDTSTKPILEQEKRTYHIAGLDVWMSNEFDGARLNNATQLNDSTVLATILPENMPINNSAYYAFKIWSSAPKTMYVKLDYPDGYTHRYRPKIMRDDQWSVIDSTREMRDGEDAIIKVELAKAPIIMAAQEVSSSQDVKEWYEGLMLGKPHVRYEMAGKSRRGRDIPAFDIYSGSPKGKDVIVILTRQHPPEVTGFYAYQYFMETLLADNELTRRFFERYRVLTFPIVNPDGVDMGHWRHNAGGVDTNRDWSRYRQPEIKNVVSYISKKIKKDKSRIALGLDFHSTWHDVFYTNDERASTTLPTFIDDWFAALEDRVDGYEVNEAANNSRSPVSKGWMLYGHGATGITYEIGDDTPIERIEVIGKESATAMMEILLGY